MRLNTLEIKGFKSFGDRVVVHFDKGVTSIVGPNGSGKSNIVDAMRWVLGEQKTRMLRSEKMENIIFNGTKKRKPANSAEVSLTFENTKNVLPTEYTTVKITRKLFRSGDSEYSLNGVTCRLKDITNLFMDTGIGPDSYSIIELKMVDDILNDKSNSIKVLLEEAAGITKYKLRKKQTFQKLEDTEKDLLRVDDLLSEIIQSLKLTERQAKKAERFKKKKIEYKDKSITLSVHDLSDYRNRLTDLKHRHQEHEDKRVDSSVKLNQLEARLQELKTVAIEKEQALAEAQKVLNDKILQITHLENDKKSSNDRLNYLLQREQQLNESISKDKALHDELQNSVVNLDEQKIGEITNKTNLEQQLNVAREELEKRNAELNEAQSELRDIESRVSATREKISQYETRTAIRETKQQSIQQEVERIEHLRSSNQTELDACETELAQIIPSKEGLQNELEELHTRSEDLDNKIVTLDQNLADEKQKLVDLNRELDAKNNELKLTKNMLEQMEGYPESIKFLKRSNAKTEKAPLLSEVIVSNDEYKVAIENYLDSYLNFFIVNGMEDAWQAINLLSDSSKGKANFFILDKLRNQTISTHETPAGTVAAIDQIEYDAEYTPLFKHLLSNVFIADSEEKFLGTEPDTDKLVVLSKSGRFQKRKFSLGGGSIGLFDGKQTGKLKELQKLTDKIEVIKTQIVEVEAAVELHKNQLAEAKEEFKNVSADKNAKQNEIGNIESRYRSLLNSKEFLIKGINTYLQNIDGLHAELQNFADVSEEEDQNIADIVEHLQEELQEVSNLHLHSREKTKELQDSVSQQSDALNELNIEFVHQQNKVDNIGREITEKQNQIARLEENSNTNHEELGVTKEKIMEQSEFMKNSDDGLQNLIEDKLQFEKSVTESETLYYQSKGDIDEHERQITESRRLKENADAILNEVNNQTNELKLELNSLKERLKLEFNVDINELLEQEAPEEETEIDVHALRESVDKLRTQLENFGPVNEMALEQYEEIKERHDFIINEKEDLITAKESLLQTIAEIDQKASEQLLEAFEVVRENFIKVFRTLFTEDDNCNMLLADPSNPLESDIHIIAQPKGKRPLSIHQLSGGEKTLTATALLFSIYLLKPSPFCIFDEVDAPLDDMNIDKFNNIIREFSKESQFIIITHNKRTMAATDIMYGIAMAEEGVTSVVPVSLEQYA